MIQGMDHTSHAPHTIALVTSEERTWARRQIDEHAPHASALVESASCDVESLQMQMQSSTMQHSVLVDFATTKYSRSWKEAEKQRRRSEKVMIFVHWAYTALLHPQNPRMW